MDLQARRFLFYGFFILFILFGAGVLFYSFGWRITIENCSIIKLSNCSIKFQKTGAIYIETQPKEVVIKIDGKIFPDKSSLIQSGTLITDLLPKTYKVEVEKEGYRQWQKNLSVKTALVTEAPRIILVPEKIIPAALEISKPIDDFWINSDKKIVFKNDQSLYFLNNFLPLKLRGKEFIAFSEDGAKMITKDSKSQIFFLYEINNLSKILNLSSVFKNLNPKSAIEEIAFYPSDSNRFIIKSKSGFLYFLDLNRLTLEKIIKESVLNWGVKNPYIYYIKKSSASNQSKYLLGAFNLILRNENIVAEAPPYLIDKKFIFSPDDKKIAFDNGGNLDIYFLSDYHLGINKKAGDLIDFDFYKNKPLKKIFWYKDSYHLFIETPTNSVDFIEIDDRPPVNKYSLIEKADHSYYDPKLNRLYFTQNKILYFIEF